MELVEMAEHIKRMSPTFVHRDPLWRAVAVSRPPILIDHDGIFLVDPRVSSPRVVWSSWKNGVRTRILLAKALMTASESNG